MSSIVFSNSGADGTTTATYPKDDNLQTRMRTVILFTTNAQDAVVTITHGVDPEKTRRVTVIDEAASRDAIEAAGELAANGVIKTDATTTTITFGAASTGKVFRVIIEFA